MSEFSLEELIPLLTEVIESGGEFRLFPKGTSMLPLLRQGLDSVALVSLKNNPKRGDILLYRRESGQYVLHRLMRVEKDDSLCFSGDNHMELERGIKTDQIIAKVEAVFRKSKRKSSQGLFLACYGKLMTYNLFKRALHLARNCLARLRGKL